MDSLGQVAVVADDHGIFRAGLAALLKRDLGFAQVHEAGSLDESLDCLSAEPVSLASFDLVMPGMDGIGSLLRVRQAYPAVRTVVITASERRQDMLLGLQIGIHGYVPKALGIDEISRALRLVIEGQLFVPPTIAEIPHATREPAEPAVPAVRKPIHIGIASDLSPVQKKVLQLLAQGCTTGEIAAALEVSRTAAQAHVEFLMRTLDVKDPASALVALSGQRVLRE